MYGRYLLPIGCEQDGSEAPDSLVPVTNGHQELGAVKGHGNTHASTTPSNGGSEAGAGWGAA